MKQLNPLLLIVVAFFQIGLLSAQSIDKCSADNLREAALNQDPSLQDAIDQSEIAISNYINRETESSSQVVLTIPVVIHVIHNGEAIGTGTNISEAQALSAITRLNEDFRKTRGDTLSASHPFYGDQADTEIEFCLVSKAPNGDATTGIERYNMNKSSWTENETETIAKPSTIWDRHSYMNMWCINLDDPASPGVDGYGTFPTSTSDTTDGVVILYTVFGDSPSGKSIVATHEVGHYLNLNHIWGDNDPDCGDDLVSDTPPTNASNEGCPSFPHNPNNSCGSDADGEMFMNYMDYSDADCTVMFTNGQKDRMQATLMTLRSSLLTSTACSSSPAAKDWTHLVYMVGSDLESGSNAGTNDLAEMVAGATSTDQVNMIVLTGGSNKPGWETPKSYIIENGAQVPLNFVPTSTDMASPDNLKEFIDWGIQTYPAQSYMVTFWNHGGEIRGFGWVDGSDRHLSINQIQTALGQTSFISNGNKFDAIGFDACLMANLEVQTMLKDYAFYYVASEETEPGHGWNWQPIVEGMQGGNSTYGDQIGTIIVDSYQQHAMDEETFNSGVTLSVTDLSRVSGLSDTLQLLLNKVKADGAERLLQKAVAASEEYGKSAKEPSTSSDVIDLGDLMAQLKKVAPSLSTEADHVLTALEGVVLHHINDIARPKATGMTVYLPHNVFSEEGELEFVIDSVYTPLNIASPLKDFVLSDYVPFVTSDNSAGSGFRTTSGSSASFGASGSSSRLTTILTLTHDDDLESVQVVLDTESSTTPNEYTLLGTTFPDSVVQIDAFTDEYYFFWDDTWLGLNGHPAYISDLYVYEVEDDAGVLKTYRRVQIPAVLNLGTQQEKDIIIVFRFDENYDATLESIMRETEGSAASRIVQKERIFLQPGDEIQLLYEVYNEDTGDDYYYEKPGANFTIVNGNQDLEIAYARLDAGTYNVGFYILDHSQNDTIIWDETPYVVTASGTAETFAQNQIQMFPNPSDVGFNIECPSGAGKADYLVSLIDVSGKVVFSTQMNQEVFIETASFPNGVYQISLTAGDRVIIDQVVIQH